MISKCLCNCCLKSESRLNDLWNLRAEEKNESGHAEAVQLAFDYIEKIQRNFPYVIYKEHVAELIQILDKARRVPASVEKPRNKGEVRAEKALKEIEATLKVNKMIKELGLGPKNDK